MKVKEIQLSPSAKLVQDYVNEAPNAEKFFDYKPYEQNSYTRRFQELMKRNFTREQLVATLKRFNETFTYSEQSLKQLDKLLDRHSVAVVGGQQPGVFTGPLYTIYKALTVIQLAKQQEEKLGVPVVPIFWIAGEDHDLDEVNDLYLPLETETMKVNVKAAPFNRVPLSKVFVSEEERKIWLEVFGKQLRETEHTKQLLQKITTFLKAGDSYVHFFGELLTWLFKDEGLVLLDANDPDLRQLEKDMFSQIIEKNEAIHRAFLEQQRALIENGYEATVETTENHGNLFYLVNNERVRVERHEEKHRYFQVGQLEFSEQQLLDIVEKNPEKLSNNVVTRPLMQEHLLPVLAFVAGPGEIAYWSSLKNVFKQFEYCMPPVVPRLQMTIIDRQTEKYLHRLQLNVEDVFSGAIEEVKQSWLEKTADCRLEDEFSTALKQIKAIHETLDHVAGKINITAQQLREKNYLIIAEQIHWLQKRFQKELQKKYGQQLLQYDKVLNMIRPNNKPQERIFNVLFYLNLYGNDFVTRLMELDLQINERHKLIFM